MKNVDFAKIAFGLIICMVMVSLLQLVQVRQLRAEIVYHRSQVNQIRAERTEMLIFAGIELSDMVDIAGAKG